MSRQYLLSADSQWPVPVTLSDISPALEIKIQPESAQLSHQLLSTTGQPRRNSILHFTPAVSWMCVCVFPRVCGVDQGNEGRQASAPASVSGSCLLQSIRSHEKMVGRSSDWW
ncbi:hypothetical protein RRG08_047132 [Elysia crispata]|uniref:Uncharacterized protein n=1 Tax=Elysia crispata TaxID=231223 RepID=A0AAE1ANX4_9GAST|nr:hypothetical protein RRG08_047132 [Elysia crispata]